ncbi:hypothetical protein Esti_006103 [Eimeria stiedai]
MRRRRRHWGGPSYAVYVTYATSKEAVAAIQGVDGAVYEGKTLKASFGTTKYCSNFLKGVRCQNPDCSYLHQLGSGKDSIDAGNTTHFCCNSSSSCFNRDFTKEAMISAKHQFLDLTFPSTSERKPTASSFGKLPESRSRNAQGLPSEDAEVRSSAGTRQRHSALLLARKQQQWGGLFGIQGQGDAAENGEAGLGPDSGDDSDAYSDSALRRGFGKSSAGSGTSSSAGSAAAAAAAAAPAVGAFAEGEDAQKAGRDPKAKAKPQGPSCSTWASVAAGSAKPTAAAAAASSASMPACASHAKSQGQSAAAPPGLSASQPAQQQQQRQQQQRRQEVEEADEHGCDTEQLEEDECQSVQSAVGGAESAAEQGFSEPESQEAETEIHPADASLEPSAAAEVAEAAATTVPAQADDEGMERQQQQQHQRQHEQQEPPQQLPSWPCFHPTFPQRPLGSAVPAASGLQGSLLDAVGAPVLPPAVSTAAAAAPHQLRPLPAAQQQQQQPSLQQPEQPQRSLLATLDVSSLSPTEQLMQQLQQQQQQLRPCAPDRMLLGADQMEAGSSRFGAPPGLEGLGGPSGSNRGCRTRSRSNSSGSVNPNLSVFALPGMGHLGPAGAAAGCRPFVDDAAAAAAAACAGAGSNSSNGGSRFAFASAACEEEDALFEIPGVEDCVLWLTNPTAQSAASAAAAEAAAAAAAQQQHQQQQGHALRSSERAPLVDPGGGGMPLPTSLANNWAQQRPPSKDFVFGPGVGGASLPTLQQPQQQQRQQQQQQQQQQQRQPLERWRQALQQQHPAALAMQGKTLAGAAPAGTSVFDRFDCHSARRTGWNSFDRFPDPQQQQQLQHEQLQQLLGQQHHMLLQQPQQQPQPRARGAAALPVPPEQQQPQLLLQQQQQQQQQQLALLQQLLPAACALGRGGSALPADPEEALKLLLSLIPNSTSQAQRPPLQQQPSQPRYGDTSNSSSSSSNSGFCAGTSGSREADALGRTRASRLQGGAALPRGLAVGGASGPLPVSRSAQELGATDGFWGAAAAAAAAAASATFAESSRGRSAARRGSGCSGEMGDRGPAFAHCGTGSYPHFDSQLSDASQCPGASSARAGGGLPPAGGPGAPVDPAALHPVCGSSPPAAQAGSSELLPFLQRQRMQQLQQQKLQQLQRALESQRLE